MPAQLPSPKAASVGALIILLFTNLPPFGVLLAITPILGLRDENISVNHSSALSEDQVMLKGLK